MLEDIAPATRSSQRVKVMTALPGSRKEDLVFDSHISFLPFINYLKSRSAGNTDIRSRFYNYLVDRFEAVPALLEPISDSRLLSEHSDILELLGTSLFPVVADPEKNIFTLAVPYQFSIFSESGSFRKLFVDGEDHFVLPENETTEHLKQVHSSLIYEQALNKFYGIQLNANTDLLYSVVDVATGMKRYYKLRYDSRFIDIHPKGELPPIQDCAVCLNTFRILDLEQQLKTMPLELFSAEGFGIWVAEDVTTHESLEEIKKILLRQESCDTSVINDLKKNIHALVGLNEVEIGLVPFVKLNNEFVLDETCTKHGVMSRNWKSNDEESMNNFRGIIGFLSESPEPTPVAVLDEKLAGAVPFLKGMWDEGVRSYLVYPVQNNDGFLGLLELASPIPNQITLDVVTRLEPAMPLLSLALLKNRDTFSDRIEKMIKEKFTALQPSVEWKFANVAWEYMQKSRSGMPVSAGNVAFENVYPLYGAIDVRNSSFERSAAIQKDTKAQLDLVDDTLDKLQSMVQLPLLEGLRFKSQNLRQAINDILRAEDEVRINDFFENEAGPVLQHLQKCNRETQEVVENYFNLVNDCSSYLHRYRDEYETALAAINNAVLVYLEEEEEKLQGAYPHYFEKYRTDGVEYNIYIGQSIAPANPFDTLYLRNIRLWQLRSMAEIACITQRLLPSLPTALQTTQLLLVHNQPITISFRKDERRFDVEGSYNIRYEIMKKRLDKVRVKDTNERLTQPGKIAMVYSNAREAQEYGEYIQFLQSKKILSAGTEFLDLEELQGVTGLKALRVSIEIAE